jgi:NDP-sugar pyrophosphorylase family protein
LIAFILAAGEGTRLRPITSARPKPLVQVCDQPLIEYSFQALRQLGIRIFAINTYYLSDQIEAYLAKRQLRFPDETYLLVKEQTLMGTGGGVQGLYQAYLQKYHNLDCQVMIVNADAFFHFDLQRLIDVHCSGKHEATIALKPSTKSDPFGRIGTDMNHRVVRIAEVEGVNAQDECDLSAYLGVQIVSQSILERVEARFSDIFRTAYKERLLCESHQIYGCDVMTSQDRYAHYFWFDVGTPRHLIEAHQFISDLLDQPDEFRQTIIQMIPKYIMPQMGIRVFINQSDQSDQSDQIQIIGQWTFKNVWIGSKTKLKLINTSDQILHLRSVILMDDCDVLIESSLENLIFFGKDEHIHVSSDEVNALTFNQSLHGRL